jgi:SAM-dependent methyltransferase
VWPGLDVEGPVLDLACGRGRNARAVLEAGAPLVALDRDRDRLRILRASVRPGQRALAVQADLETGHGIPTSDAAFGVVLVFRYLHRPLAREIERVLRPGGWLVYETFTRRQRELGHGPRRDAFLLEPGELPQLFPGLRCERFEEIVTPGERPAAVARLLARKPAG